MNKTIENQYFEGEKRYEDLTITDNFMFAKVMLNEQLCKKFLEMILHIRIRRIEYYNDEKTLKKFYHLKGIRLDVYLNDEYGTIYNIEMQNSRHANLSKRSRYYQGMIDLNLLEPGDDYNKLERSYVIFICTFDLFGKGRHIYTFENRCVEELDLVLPDEAVKVFINTTGTVDDIDEEFLDLMNFFNGELATAGIAKEMQKEVDKVKSKEEWRVEYMTMMELERQRYREGMERGMEHAKEKYREGMEQGREEGIEQGIRYSVKQTLKYGANIDDVIRDIMLEYDMTEDRIKEILDKR
ncbi:MAG: Rpn family recombination-promoting nuclease/putative transposase [Lachnospira sp.]|nr:Rpn family recombination-promoting nuclease/putative transposase [Lachnospira sp.]